MQADFESKGRASPLRLVGIDKLFSSGILTAGLGFFARASNQLSTLVLTFVAARHLSPTEFGSFSLAILAVTLIRTLLYCGAFEFLLKARDSQPCAREALAVNFLVAIALSLPSALVALSAWYLWDAAEIARLLLILLPSNLISAVTAWQESLCLRGEKTKSYYAITTAAEIISTGIAIGMFVLGFGLLSLVAKVYFSAITASILYTRTATSMWPKGFDGSKFKEIIRWSFERYGAVLLTFGSTYAADLILGAVLSPAATGLYRGSSRLVTSVADLFNQPTRLMGMTFYSKRASRELGSGETVPLVFAVAAAAGWSALGGLAVVSPSVVPLLLGPAWSEAVPIVSILCLARAFSLVDACVAPALVAYNRQRSVFLNQFMVIPVLVAALLFLAPFGVLAATYGVVIAACFNSICLLYSLRKHLQPTLTSIRNAASIALVPTISVIMGSVAANHVGMAMTGNSATRFALSAICGTLCWCLALFIIKRPLRSVLVQLRAPS